MLFGIRAWGAHDSVIFRKRTHLLASTALALAAVCALSGGGAALAADTGYVLPGTLGSAKSYGVAINADGTVVVGYIGDTNGTIQHAYSWTESSGMIDLDPTGTAISQAMGVSDDGTVIVGKTTVGGQRHAVVWTSGTMSDFGTLGGPNSSANAVSADGTVIVGNADTPSAGQRAFRWVQGQGAIQSIGSIAGNFSSANDVSADGSVVVGRTATNAGGDHAYRWTPTGLFQDIGTLAGGSSEAWGVSADGLVVVGSSHNPAGNNGNDTLAFRWVSGAGPMVNLGMLGGDSARANATSADGSVVVGNSTYATGNDATRAFRWTDATGMQSVEDWLRANGMTVATDFTKDAKDVSADGYVIVGTTATDTTFVARIQPPPSSTPGNSNPPASGGSGIIDLDQYSQTIAGRPGVQIGLDYAGTAMNGVHGEPMRNLLSAGRQSISVTSDAGYDSGDTSEGFVGLGDLAYGIGLDGGATARFAVGGLYTHQDIDTGGHFSQQGVYLAPEITLPIAGSVYATIGGYYAPGRLDIDRGYLNGGMPDSSEGETDTRTWAAKLRFDWLNAASIQDTKLTPYASLTYIQSHMDGYTETGGSFPSRFDDVNEHATVARIGLDTVTDITDHLRLTGKAEAAYRFEKQTSAVGGSIIGVSGFNLSGHDIDQFWLRGAVGAEFDMGGGTASLSVNASTEGDDPTVWLKSGWRVTF
jgi:probable HAF family extracellular repeat protein